MLKNKNSGFTLLEMLVVVIIVGITATLAIPHFTVSRERVFGREAIASLRMIAAAERMYRMELTPDLFIACNCLCSGTAATCCNNTADGCNFLLRLDLNTDHWTYAVTVTAGPPPTFRATANRIGAGGFLNCQYVLTHAGTDPAPTVVADCPP